MYITKHLSPDLCNLVRELSKVNRKEFLDHFVTLLTVCEFLFENKNLGVRLVKSYMDENWKLEAYCDSDWDNDKDNRKSVTGVVIFINGNTLCWVSRSQKTVSLASAHAEYNAITEVCKEVLYIKYIMEFLEMDPKLPIIIYCDNIGVIFLSNNQESRLSKHLDIKVHFVREYDEQVIVKIIFIRTNENLADSFTKSGGEDSYKRNFMYLDKVCSDSVHHNKGGC